MSVSTRTVVGCAGGTVAVIGVGIPVVIVIAAAVVGVSVGLRSGCAAAVACRWRAVAPFPLNPDRPAAIAARRSSANQESDLLHVGFDVAGRTAGRRFRRPLRGATALRRRGAGSRYRTRAGTWSRRLREG